MLTGPLRRWGVEGTSIKFRGLAVWRRPGVRLLSMAGFSTEAAQYRRGHVWACPPSPLSGVDGAAPCPPVAWASSKAKWSRRVEQSWLLAHLPICSLAHSALSQGWGGWGEAGGRALLGPGGRAGGPPSPFTLLELVPPPNR